MSARCATLVTALAVALVASAQAPMTGRRVVDVLEQYRAQGVQVIYSDELVTTEMRVEREPAATDPKRVLEEILAGHDLTVREGPDDTLIVVRAPLQPRGSVQGIISSRGEGRPLEGAVVQLKEGSAAVLSDTLGRFELLDVPVGTAALEVTRPGFVPTQRGDLEIIAGRVTMVDIELELAPAFTDEIVVTPSRYTLLQRQPEARRFLDREEVDRLPHFADDLFRVMDHVPGSSQPDFVSEFRLRGGDHNETLLLLDGVPLYQPFHFKQILGLLSTIDAEAVGGMEVLTGGFGAAYGDRMGGVVEVHPSIALAPRRTSAGVSFLTARFISEGLFDDGRGSWLVAARRGYLDLLLKGFADTTPGFQEGPTYHDLLATVRRSVGDRSTLSGSIFASQDNILYDSEEDDDTAFDSAAESYYAWVDLTTEWTPDLRSRNLLWATRVSSFIAGHKEDLGSSFTEVDDDRRIDVLGFKSTWEWNPQGRHSLHWGVDIRDVEASYDYLEHSILTDPRIVGQGPPILTDWDIDMDLGGTQLALHAADRIRLGERVVAELGLRWDHQAWAPGNDQVSPRLNLAVDLKAGGILRLAWGRYAQSQNPDEIMVTDGLTEVFPAQWAEHRIVTWEWPFADGYDLRIEAYQKLYDDLRPRFENLYEPYELFAQGLYDRVRIDPEAAEAAGIEILLRSDPRRRWSWWVSYVRSKVEDLEGGRWVPRYWDQPHALSISVNWRPGEAWNFNLTGHEHTGWPTTPQTADLRQRPDGSWWLDAQLGERNSMRVPDYLRFDLRASRVFHLKKSDLSFFVEVMNLFNRDNPRYPLFKPDIDRLVEGPVDVEVSYEEHWMTLAPSFGVTWSF